MLPKHPHSPNHREEKGKGKALPAVFDSSSEEESSEEEDNGRASPSPRAKKNENRLGNALKRTMSVGGIERELNAVRQAHAEKEAAWEGADTTVVHDEREDFLEKIHGLEAEVQRLRAEVCYYFALSKSKSLFFYVARKGVELFIPDASSPTSPTTTLLPRAHPNNSRSARRPLRRHTRPTSPRRHAQRSAHQPLTQQQNRQSDSSTFRRQDGRVLNRSEEREVEEGTAGTERSGEE